MDKLLEGLERPERMANIIAQQPKHIRDDIAGLVEDEQKPGSFGDLIKRSVELAGAHNEFQGSNVVSMIGRYLKNNVVRGQVAGTSGGHSVVNATASLNFGHMSIMVTDKPSVQ